MGANSRLCRIGRLRGLFSNSEIVRCPIGTLYGINRECCPPSVRNHVRDGAERATGEEWFLINIFLLATGASKR